MGKARDYIPALRYNHKIMPEDIAGMAGMPHVGNIYYVDPVNGSDSANSGTSWDDAFDSFGQAYSAVTTNNYDVIVIAPGGTGSGSGASVGSALTFSKNLVTVIGAAAPSMNSPRARILVDDTTYSLTISGNGNRFINVQLGCFVDVNVPFTLSGDRNYFSGVHFAGMGIAAAGTDTAGRSLVISGADENLFESCEFGLTTIDRTVANTEVEFASTASRNKFINCVFTKSALTLTTSTFCKTTSNGLGSYTLFDNCTFYAFWVNHADKIAGAFDFSSQATTADVILKGENLFVGCDDIEATASNIVWLFKYVDTNPGTNYGIATNNVV